MSDKDINKMDFKELRQEVQNLRDEFALFMRKYNDTIYNLDSDNFGRSFTVEQKNMKTQLKITAEGLKSTVAKMDNFSTVEQTAAMIRTTVNVEYVTTLLGSDIVTNAALKSAIEQTAESIKSHVSAEYETKDNASAKYSTLESSITQTSTNILLSVSADYETKDNASAKYSSLETSINQTAGSISILAGEINSVGDDVSDLQSEITVNKNSISAIVSGSHTKDLLDGYLTGIEITSGSIKMLDSDKYSIYDKSGLHFYNSRGTQGWAIEPHATYGGELKYYFDGSERFVFGQGMTRANPAGGNFYGTNDIVVRASEDASRFVVDLTDSDYKEIKFVGLSNVSSDTNSPYIYANEKLLATQDWVKAQNYGSGGGTGGTVVAVFG